MATPVCRIATPEDFTALADLRWRLKAESEDIKSETFDQYGQRFTNAMKNAHIAGDVVHWLAVTDAAIVAAMSVVIVNKIPSPGKSQGQWGYLTNCFTLETARNQGVGKHLLTTVKDWARETALELLIVWPSDEAVTFYEREGFSSGRDPLMIEFD